MNKEHQTEKKETPVMLINPKDCLPPFEHTVHDAKCACQPKTGEGNTPRGRIVATARTFAPNRKPQIKFELAYQFGDEITWREVNEKEWCVEAFRAEAAHERPPFNEQVRSMFGLDELADAVANRIESHYKAQAERLAEAARTVLDSIDAAWGTPSDYSIQKLREAVRSLELEHITK
jgi:hypothetical protein